MAKTTHLYSCRTGAQPLTYIISKLSEELEVLSFYTLTEPKVGSALHCDCPARKGWCRHCDMLRKFQAEERIDTGWMYRFENSEWVPPATDIMGED